MADKEKPYKLPMVGKPPKKRLSRAEFEELVRTMGARAARDYMRDEDLFSEVDGSDIHIRPSRRRFVEASRVLNLTSPPFSPDDESDKARKSREVRRATAEDLSRATGMKDGGMVKAGKVTKFKNGGCVMAGRGVRNTKVL
jgi:hypothetical protein